MCKDTSRKPSVVKPWLKIWPKELAELPIPCMPLKDYVAACCKNHDQACVEYYGTTFTLTEVFEKSTKVAKALAAMGVKEGDHLPVFTAFQPEFLFLLFGAEMVGAALICRDGTTEEYVDALQNSKGSVAFAQDFLSKEEEEIFYGCCEELKNIVVLDPYFYAKKDEMPDYVIDAIDSRYPAAKADRTSTITWAAFEELGKDFTGEYMAPADPDRSLYHPYTSGSTGPSKEIYLTAHSIIGLLGQLVPMMQFPFQMKCLMAVLPPALIAMVGAIVLLNIATGCLQCLDPFVRIEDVDLELMRYKPNSCNLGISVMGETLVNSTRIPEDYNMEWLYMMGGGAEPANNKRIDRFQEWYKQHKSPATYTMGYGQSEAGSAITIANPMCDFHDSKSGMVMPQNIVATFDKDNNELDFNEVGEICVLSPANMKCYAKPEDTAKTLVKHADGNVWLHTGDWGRVTEMGEVQILSRYQQERFGGGYLYLLHMENKVCYLEGVKDVFFLTVPDEEHEGYFEPHMYMCPEEGYDYDEVKARICAALDPHEVPVVDTRIEKREYFHFKTNRRVLTAQIVAERAAKKAAK